jgi:hypothetical protein
VPDFGYAYGYNIHPYVKFTVKINDNIIPYYSDSKNNLNKNVGNYINIPKIYEPVVLTEKTDNDVILELNHEHSDYSNIVYSSEKYKYVLINMKEYNKLSKYYLPKFIRISKNMAKKNNIILYNKYSFGYNMIKYKVLSMDRQFIHQDIFHRYKIILECVGSDYPNLTLYHVDFPILKKAKKGDIFKITKETADECKRKYDMRFKMPPILKLNNNTKNNNNVYKINKINSIKNTTTPAYDGPRFINTYTLKPNNGKKRNITITSNNYPILKEKDVKKGNKIRVPKKNMNEANN